MKKILLASHGRFASGIKSSMNILLGASDNLQIFDAYIDETNVENVIDDFYKTVNEDDQVILMSDLYGGSVNQIMFRYINRPNTTLVTGVNLACVLEIAASSNDLSKDEIKEIVANAKEAMLVVEDNVNNEEEEFF